MPETIRLNKADFVAAADQAGPLTHLTANTVLTHREYVLDEGESHDKQPPVAPADQAGPLTHLTANVLTHRELLLDEGESHDKQPPVAPAAAPWLSTLCFHQSPGGLIGRKLERCDQGNKTQIKLSEVFNGGLLRGEDIYACVSTEKPRQVFSGLYASTEAKSEDLKCSDKGGHKKAKKISLSPNGRLVWNWSHTHDREHGHKNRHGQHTHKAKNVK